MYYVWVPLLPIFVILFTVLFAGAKAVVDFLPTLFVLLLIKNAVVHGYLGIIKHRKSIFICIFQFVADLIRTHAFFSILTYVAEESSTGIDVLFFPMVFIFWLFVGGGVFLFGELCSLGYGGTDSDKKSMVVANAFATVLAVCMRIFFF